MKRPNLVSILLTSAALATLVGCGPREGELEPNANKTDWNNYEEPTMWDPGDRPPGSEYGSGSGMEPGNSDPMETNNSTVEPPKPCDEITFEYSGAASTVWVTGSFNDWAPTLEDGALELVEGEDGTFSLTTTIEDKGTHHYKLIVDGNQWVEDPNNGDKVTDNYQGYNSVLTVCDTSPAPPCGVVTFSYVNQSAGSVKLAGSFLGAEDWAQSLTEMRQVNGVWRITTTLDEGRNLYKFVVDDNNWIADPGNMVGVDDGFGGQNSVLDVSCDSAGLCGDVDAFDWRDSVMYFAMVDRFYDSDGQSDPVPGASGLQDLGASGQYEGGDLAGVTAKLDYLRDLGVSTIWLSAPFDNRDLAGAAIDPNADPKMYSAYHGYWPAPANIDYSGAEPNPRPKVESRIGSEQDLRDLIDTAHETLTVNGHEMKVLFDYVMNHVDEESGLYKAHPEWFVPGTPLCAVVGWDNPGTHCAFTSYLPVFDYDVPAARKWSIDDAVWWAKEFNLDGYRLDAIKHVPDSWMLEFRERFNQEFPDPDGGRFYLVGETYTWDGFDVLKRYVDPQTKLDGQFDFPFRKETCEAVMGGGNFRNLSAFMDVNDFRYGPGALMSPFMGNHDIPRVIHNATGTFGCTQGSWAGIAWTPDYSQPADAWPYEKLAVSYAVMFTNPGLPLLYYGDEIGLAGGGDPDNRRMMPWNDSSLNQHQKNLRDRVKELTRIRGENKALTRGRRSTLSVDDDTWVYRMGGCGTAAPDVIVAINRADSPRSVNVPSGSYTDLRADSSAMGGSISIPARDYVLLRAD